MAAEEEETEYRIAFTIERKRPEDDDFVEIGFGSSGAWTSPDQALHILSSDVQNYHWETEGGMPDPSEIKDAIEKTGRADV